MSEELKNFRRVDIFGSMVAFACVLWVTVFMAVIAFTWIWPIAKIGTLGAFGDTFGAISGLFNGLAFAGVAYTVVLQRKSLEKQEDALRIQKEELESTKSELTSAAQAQEAASKAQLALIELSALSAQIQARTSLLDHAVTLRRAAGTEVSGPLRFSIPEQEDALEKCVNELDRITKAKARQLN